MKIAAGCPELEPDVGPSRPVRVVVAGAGKMGVLHAAVLSMTPGVTLAGFQDVAPGAATRLRGTGFAAPLTTDIHALLREQRPDAAWVCTPPDTHLDVARTCIEAGVAVFVEKPLAQSLDAARALAELARGRGVPLACGYTLAFWPSFALARHLVRQRMIGTVRRVRSSMVCSQVFGPQRGWMYDRARSGGGVVANLSSHLLFVLCSTFGIPSRVEATWRHIHSRVEDELDATLEAPGGVEIRFESSWCVPGFPLSRTTLEVEGDEGRIAASNDAVDLTLTRAAFDLPAGTTRLGPADLPQPARFDMNGEAYALEDAHFLRWITGGPRPAIDADAALAVQVVMDALYRSAEHDGAPVDVAERS